ncbi:MAG: DJ-1/PfpI family protein [Terrimicrobiaceae bacterium]|nr:DJ-1/PfpI family protein [Terrimicrobiaceae bacterium]
MLIQATVLIFAGAEELDVFGPYEVLCAARLAGAGIETSLATVGEPGPVRLAHGTTVISPGRFDRADLLVVPGGGWANRSAAGARSEAENPATLAALRTAHAAGTVIAGVCTGAMLLARAGLLARRPAITHHSAVEDLRASGATITGARVVDDGDVVTCGGVTAGIDLALWLVERFCGAACAARTAAYLEYERRGEVRRG